MVKKNQLRQINLWVRDMIYNKSVNFHPDTPIADYINTETRAPPFPNPEKLQNELGSFFDICAQRDIDICALTLPIFRVYLKKHLGLVPEFAD